VTALTKIVDHILKEMDQGNYTGVLLLDFKKALVHHPCTFSISSFSLMLMSDMELDEKCIVVSSAYKSDILWST
jgi:hypothetical protein